MLKAKPDSPVGVLADGTTSLTAFLPTDRAFQRLAESVTGKHIKTEKGVFTAVAGLSIDTVEAVLLYHVVPGATITYKQARRSDNLVLTTALDGATVRVNLLRGHKVSLVDLDRQPQPADRPQGPEQGQPADRARHRPRAATGGPALTPELHR